MSIRYLLDVLFPLGRFGFLDPFESKSWIFSVPETVRLRLQAYLTRDSNAVESFRQVALRDGWGLCELVVDQSHGQKAERDFLYLSQQAEDRPPRCVLYEHAQATCALALESWTYRTGAPHPVRLDAAHRAWLVREHDRYARRMLRLHKRFLTICLFTFCLQDQS